MDTLIAWDKALFLWLNGLGIPTFDGFWMLMTHRASNVVVYLFLWLFISEKTPNSLILLAINCVNCEPKSMIKILLRF